MAHYTSLEEVVKDVLTVDYPYLIHTGDAAGLVPGQPGLIHTGDAAGLVPGQPVLDIWEWDGKPFAQPQDRPSLRLIS